MPIANIEQAEAWDGHEGDQWTEQADRYEGASWRVLADHLPPISSVEAVLVD